MGPKGTKTAPRQKKGDELSIPVDPLPQPKFGEELGEKEEEEGEGVEGIESVRIDENLATFLEDRP